MNMFLLSNNTSISIDHLHFYFSDVLLTTEVGIEVWLRDDSTFYYDRLIPYPLENEGTNKAQQLSLADISKYQRSPGHHF